MKQNILIILINDIFLTDVLIFGLHSLTTAIASEALYLLLYSIPVVILSFFFKVCNEAICEFTPS